MGSLCLNAPHECERWLDELAGELHRRYVQDATRNGRAPTRISMSASTSGIGGGAGAAACYASRQRPINLGTNGSVQQIAGAARDCFRRWLTSSTQMDGALGVVALGLSLSGMQPIATHKPISNFFGSRAQAAASTSSNCEDFSSPAIDACLIDLESSECDEPAIVDDHDVKMVNQRSGEADDALELKLLEPRRPALLGRPPPHPPSLTSPAASGAAELTAVDPRVLAELPPDIQAEVRQQLHLVAHKAQEAQPAAKRQKRVGGGIEAFFRPAARSAAGA